MTATEKLIQMIPKMGAVEFTGLARILKVKLLDIENEKTRDFADVLDDVLKSFDCKNREEKREILRIVKASSKSKLGDDENASNT